MADKYKNWKELTENETEREDYEVEVIKEYSPWSHLAIHGGGMELMTSTVAREVAVARRQNYASLLGIKDKDNNDLHIGVTHFDAPWALSMQKGADYTFSFHGRGETDVDTIYVGGNDPDTQKKVVSALKKAGFATSASTKESGADEAGNIAAKNARKKGVHIELTRKFRNSLVESGDAKDEGKSKTTTVFKKFITALVSVTDKEKNYQNWKEFSSYEKEGEDYTLDIDKRDSRWSHLAIHGGRMELWTTQVAQSVAGTNKQSSYTLNGASRDKAQRQRINSIKFDEPQCVKLQKSVDYSVSYHGISNQEGDPEGPIVYVGGLDKKRRDSVIESLKNKGFTTKPGGKEAEGNNDDPKNIVNKNRSKAGVQLELNRSLRDSFSSTGDAGDDDGQPTKTFHDFVAAVASATRSGDQYQSWKSLSSNETEGYDYTVELNDTGSNLTHIAIHGGAMEDMTASVAREAAKKKDQSFFSVIAEDVDTTSRMRIPSTKFDHPDCVELQKSAYYSISYHERYDLDNDPKDGYVLVGGLAEELKNRLAEELRKKGFQVLPGRRLEPFNVEMGGKEGDGDHDDPKNIVNRTSSGSGAQLEISRNLLNRMSSTGSSKDESAKKTQTFWDFIGSVTTVSGIPDKPEVENGDQRCIRYFINDFNMNQPRIGYKLMKATEYAPSISPRRFNLTIPMFHGQVPTWQDPIDRITVQMEVRVMGRSASELRQRWDDFTGLCGAGKYAPVKLERYRGIYLSSDPEHDPMDRSKSFGEYANAQLESLPTPEFEAGSNQLVATVVFNVPAGQWRSNKIYMDRYTKNGSGQRCRVAKVSTLPVYSMIIRVQGGSSKNGRLAHWSVVDEQSNTGVAWTDPKGINLNDGEYVYADTSTMRAYISTKQDWPKAGEGFDDFADRIKGKAAWSDYRYIRNGPLSLTSKVQYVEGTKGDPDYEGLEHRSGVRIVMHTEDGKNVDGKELVIRSRAARI